MPHRMHSSFDRRSGLDRREAYTLGYLLEGGIERRSAKERRSIEERRKDWVRVSQWSSVCVNVIDPEPGSA